MAGGSKGGFTTYRFKFLDIYKNETLAYLSCSFHVFIDWVRDVAWAPNTAIPFNIVASCSEDTSVVIWKQDERNGPWKPTPMTRFEAPVWRVSWSVTGNVLAVSSGDHKVTLWKQSVDEVWSQISSVEE